MKITVTADIHYGVGNNQHIVKQCGFHYLDQKTFIKGVQVLLKILGGKGLKL